VGSSSYSVRLLPIAEQDLQDLLVHVAADHAAAALALTDRIEKDLVALGSHPFLGRVPNDETLAKLGYRMLVVENYLIFYKARGRTVFVYRIVHGARDVPSLLKDF